jgi:hypothetical protein
VRQPIPAAFQNQTEQTMRIFSILRTATLALSLVAAMGAMSTAFASSRVQEQTQASTADSLYSHP